MQKSPTTFRMQNSYWVNYYRLVFMTRFAATHGRGGQAPGTCAANHLPRSNEGMTVVMQGRRGFTQKRKCHIIQFMYDASR